MNLQLLSHKEILNKLDEIGGVEFSVHFDFDDDGTIIEDSLSFSCHSPSISKGDGVVVGSFYGDEQETPGMALENYWNKILNLKQGEYIYTYRRDNRRVVLSAAGEWIDFSPERKNKEA